MTSKHGWTYIKILARANLKSIILMNFNYFHEAPCPGKCKHKCKSTEARSHRTNMIASIFGAASNKASTIIANELKWRAQKQKLPPLEFRRQSR